MLQVARDSYRRAIWANQDAYVQVWLEKDALAGTVRRVTDPYDVPLVVTRGYASLSLLHEAAEATYSDSFTVSSNATSVDGTDSVSISATGVLP